MASVRELFDLSAKIAVITGASSGLGWDAACALAECGCKIVITSRENAKAEHAARELEKMGYEATGLELDQRSYDPCVSLMKRVMDKYGRIDILINNAGGGAGKGECNLFKRDPEAIRNMIDTNLTGSLYCCKAACEYMAKQGSGSIINLASIAGVVGRMRDMYWEADKMEQPVEYAAAKGGVIGMTRDLAAVMAPFGVRVNAISPGGFDKGELSQSFIDAYAKRTPMGHMGVIGRDIKGPIIFLASEASLYITGQNIIVDGGFSSCK
jgi:NAD(P)-dependent dehydrogenase (short-subunit alcohol dehydrogenase family)